MVINQHAAGDLLQDDSYASRTSHHDRPTYKGAVDINNAPPCSVKRLNLTLEKVIVLETSATMLHPMRATEKVGDELMRAFTLHLCSSVGSSLRSRVLLRTAMKSSGRDGEWVESGSTSNGNLRIDEEITALAVVAVGRVLSSVEESVELKDCHQIQGHITASLPTRSSQLLDMIFTGQLRVLLVDSRKVCGIPWPLKLVLGGITTLRGPSLI